MSNWATPRVHHDAGGKPRCNTPGAQLLGTGSDVSCARCLNILAGVNHGGIQQFDLKPCGTAAAYRRHLRNQGKPVRCERCLQAERIRDDRARDAYNTRRRERYAADRAAGMTARQASRRKDLRRAA